MATCYVSTFPLSNKIQSLPYNNQLLFRCGTSRLNFRSKSQKFDSSTQMHFGKIQIGSLPHPRSKGPIGGNRSKTPDIKPLDNKPPWIIEEIIAKYAFDANLFRLGFSIQNHPGSRGADPVGVRGDEAPVKKKKQSTKSFL